MTYDFFILHLSEEKSHSRVTKMYNAFVDGRGRLQREMYTDGVIMFRNRIGAYYCYITLLYTRVRT